MMDMFWFVDELTLVALYYIILCSSVEVINYTHDNYVVIIFFQILCHLLISLGFHND